MGSVISKAANGVGTALGNAFVAPVKTIFGASCEGICSGTWDITCFIEHLCISNLLRLLMVSVLAYITLLFIYLLFKVGILQCVCRSICKMSWAACKTYLTALKEITCFLWHKLKNTKRTYRRRFENVEEGYYSSSEYDSSSEDYLDHHRGVRRRSVRERRKEHIRRSLYPTRQSSKGRGCARGSRRHVRLKTREVSVHVKPGRSRSFSLLQLTGRAHKSRRRLMKKPRIW
ncbi:hypothetical protein OPV22_030455 [Ensete ventricosum]|uniref:Uncharacterized protein n=1 Tax=Ensete ventricosum TaxID=4639 RepID=A0AAV8Q459_ENSVE|nr:hypothetical protein OPV22_030455 [Ensete ventricosum]